MSKKTFLLDTLDTEDKFEVHTKICNVLYNKIIKLNEKQDSVNIGLFGEWGSGKSFIIKKLKKKLQSNKICVYEFDAWKFNGKALERSILFELEKQAFTENEPYFYKNQYRLSQKLYSKIKMESHLNVDYPNIKDKFKLLKRSIYLPFLVFVIIKFSFYIPIDCIESFGQSISNYLNEYNLKFINVAGESALYILTTLSVSTFILQLLSKDIKNFLQVLLLRREDVKEEIQQTFSSEEFEEIFKDMIKQIKSKNNNQVLIVFDNIDRCEPKYAYEIITTIKTYMSISECIYIIPCDDEALKTYLQSNNYKTNSRNYAQEFLDKFFNVNIRIPSLSNQNLDYYIEECLNDLDIDIVEENKRIIKQILYYAYKHQNPRKIKRFINDFSMYYSLALEVDKSKRFILNDIEMFTIVAAIKQCWPQLEKKIVENANFRQNFYSNNSFQHEISNEIGEDAVEFLLSTRSLFDNNKSIYSYVYYKESEDEINIINIIRQGNPIEMNEYNFKILEQEYNNYKYKNEVIYFEALMKSTFYSLKGEEGNKSREFETLFNEIILDIDKDEKLNIYGLVTKFDNEDFKYLDNINLRTKTLNKLREYIYVYVRSQKSSKMNFEDTIIKLLNSKILKYNESIRLYFKLLGDTPKEAYKCIEYMIKDTTESENIVDYIGDSEFDVIFSCIVSEQAITFNKGNINLDNNILEFILYNIEDKNNLIKRYIPRIFKDNMIYPFENQLKMIKVTKNLGLFILENSKKYNIDVHEKFIYAFLNYFFGQSNKGKERYRTVFYIYYCLTFLLTNNIREKNYKKYNRYRFNGRLNEFIVESINLLGEECFMEKIYIVGNIHNIQSGNVSILIENISKECLIKYYKNIGKNPVTKVEMKALIEKLGNHTDAENLLSLKLYDSLCKLGNIEVKKDSWMRGVHGAYKLLKTYDLLDYEVFLDKRILVNLYKIYPNEASEIICDYIDECGLDEVLISDILDFINKRLEKGESISNYKSIFNILNINENMLTTNILFEIDNILKHILKLGDKDLIHDFGCGLLTIYEKKKFDNKYSTIENLDIGT